MSQPPGDATPAAGSGPTVFLHIGTMKTGTTFLQHVLQRNASALADDGVLYPLSSGAWAVQVRAARDILGIKGRPSEGSWAEMYSRIEAWPGRAAVVSMEFYSLADDATVRHILDHLAPFDVQVIVTARDLARVLSSAWQSMIKQGHQWPFPEFVAAIRSGESDAESYRRFWLHHDLPAIVGRWSDAVGVDNVHLVTVPPSPAPPGALWERFCSVIGVDADRYDIGQDKKSNFSLSYSDAEFMRRVSGELRPQLDRLAFKRWATRYFANRVLRDSTTTQSTTDRPQLGSDTQQWTVERSVEMVAAIEQLGVHVVGDLAELIPRPAGGPDSEDAVKPEVEYPDRAAVIIAALLRRIAELDPEASEDRTRPPFHARSDDGDGDGDDAADTDYLDEADEAADELGDVIADEIGRGQTPAVTRR